MYRHVRCGEHLLDSPTFRPCSSGDVGFAAHRVLAAVLGGISRRSSQQQGSCFSRHLHRACFFVQIFWLAGGVPHFRLAGTAFVLGSNFFCRKKNGIIETCLCFNIVRRLHFLSVESQSLAPSCFRHAGIFPSQHESDAECVDSLLRPAAVDRRLGNTLVWTAITVPSGLLLLFFVGLGLVVRKKELRWPGLFLFLNFITLLVSRALPGTPAHDGTRLFVPAFAFLAILAGQGAAGLWRLERNRIPTRILVAGIYLCCLFNLFFYAPQWLSYYNVLIGGLPGAACVGMEPTYYWDGFDQEVIDWLNDHTMPNEGVVFSDGNDRAFLLNKNGRANDPHFRRVPLSFLVSEKKRGHDFRYFVLQNRPGLGTEQTKHSLGISKKKPVFAKTIRKGGLGPWNLRNVPLVEIYELGTSSCR